MFSKFDESRSSWRKNRISSVKSPPSLEDYEVSIMLAHFVFQRIDQKTQKALACCSKRWNERYKVFKMQQDRVQSIILLRESETAYVREVKVLLSYFKKPLATLTSGKSDALFCDLGPLVAMHRKMTIELSERINQFSDTSTIGDLFVAFQPALKLYQHYMSNITKNFELLNILQYDLEIKRGVLGLEAATGVSLDAGLSIPHKRMSFYLEFVRQIIRSTVNCKKIHLLKTT